MTKAKKRAAQKNILDIDKLQENFRERLPSMIDEALDAYQQITDGADDQDHKLSNARHSAAKTALSHIQQLIRLAQWAAPSISGTNSQQVQQDNDQHDLAALIARAKQKMRETSLSLTDETDPGSDEEGVI